MLKTIRTFAKTKTEPLHLSRIKLVQFKNYSDQELILASKLNCFVGKNGMGKTNLLDAIYYLCMGKSYFGLRDPYVVMHQQSFFRLEGDFVFTKKKKDQIVAKIALKKRKILERNKVAYEKLAEHVGNYPVVIIVPDDTQLITEGSEVRRRFVNNTLSQQDAVYLQELIIYNKVLKQRNALLKQYEGRPAPEDLLLVYDQQMETAANYIFKKRSDFVVSFVQEFNVAYQAISGEQETVALNYKSALKDSSLTTLLKESRERDRILQRTTKGIHRDDLVFTLEEKPLKRFGSQGQLKTFVLALKLAQYRFLQTATDKTPILLLDDIFDKLDPSRVSQLINYILANNFGQIFLSDTDPDRVEQILAAQKVSPAIFTINNGTIITDAQKA